MEIFIIIGLILLNGLLSMSEIALVSARKARLELEAKRGNKSAKTALKLANEPDRFLSTIQIGITLIGILTGLYSGEAFAYDLAEHVRRIPFLEPYALGVSKTTIVVIVTYLTLIMGELVPKRIGMGYAERVSMLVAKPMNFLSLVASPFVWLLSKSTALTVRLIGTDATEENKVTEDEIKAIVKEGFDVGEVQEVEQDIVERVFNLGDRNVGSIMTHRSELVWLDPATMQREKICETERLDGSTIYVKIYNDRVYVQDNPQERSEYGTSYSLSCYSKDHQHTVLIDTLPMNLYLPSTDNGFMPMFGSEERGWIWAQDYTGNGEINYLIDLDTGEMHTMTQTQYRDGVSLMAQTNDGRWMVGYKPHSNTHNDRCDYGFIDPQEFWNGGENYTPVQMWD